MSYLLGGFLRGPPGQHLTPSPLLRALENGRDKTCFLCFSVLLVFAGIVNSNLKERLSNQEVKKKVSLQIEAAAFDL